MDYETVTNVWLEPGTDYRVRQREQGIRTTRFGRLPLGEKGVGRFAAHKLGKQISLITKKKGQPEVVVDVNWQKFETQKYLSDVAVTVTERRPEILIRVQDKALRIRDNPASRDLGPWHDSQLGAVHQFNLFPVRARGRIPSEIGAPSQRRPGSRDQGCQSKTFWIMRSSEPSAISRAHN